MKRKIGMTIIIAVCLIEGLVAIRLYFKYKQFGADRILQVTMLKEKFDPVDRYQIKQATLAIGQIKISLKIDTQTGKTWKLISTGKITAWIPIENYVVK